MKPSLVILAAGMGSRYGGLKQVDGFGPNGETIIDYSIYDAINAGFGKIVFIIREHFRDKFEETFRSKLEGRVELEFVAQELDDLPIEYKYSSDRERPWGTAHAVWVARNKIKEPFGIINADDYYGQDAYVQLYNFLTDANNMRENNYCIIAYYLKNTLSDHGAVNRGVIYRREENLDRIVETLKISKKEGLISYEEGGVVHILEPDTLVSMNMFGFMPTYFAYTAEKFGRFLQSQGQELRSECYIPQVLDDMNEESFADIKILSSNSSWFGVTYQEDKPIVVDKIQGLIADGKYPAFLWE